MKTQIKLPDTKVVSFPYDIPKRKHWAIIQSQSVSVEGYDKGDPPETKHFLHYTAYFEQAEWETEVSRLTLKKEGFQALIVDVPTITTTVKVEIK